MNGDVRQPAWQQSSPFLFFPSCPAGLHKTQGTISKSCSQDYVHAWAAASSASLIIWISSSDSSSVEAQ